MHTKLKLLLSLIAIVCLTPKAYADVEWEFQVGGMYTSDYKVYSTSSEDIKRSANGQATLGLYLKIPVARRMFIETGLGWRHHYVFSKYKFEVTKIGDESLDEPAETWVNPEYNDWGNSLVLPVKFGYSLPLNEQNSFEFLLGPYVEYLFNSPNEYATEEIQERIDYGYNIRKATHWSVGIQPSVMFKHRALRIGMTFQGPIFYNGPQNLNKNTFMFTIGVSFGSGAWEGIGTGLAAAGTVMGAMADGYASGVAAASSNNYNDSYSDSQSSSYSSSSYSSGSNSGNQSLSQNQQLNSDKRVYSNYESMLSKFKSGLTGYTCSEVKDIQKKMRKLREKWNGKIQKSSLESWNCN